jgi:DNA-binding beta-propeller fold protein YncE
MGVDSERVQRCGFDFFHCPTVGTNSGELTLNKPTTLHQQYPKPAADHHLQVDVTRLAEAFDMVDQDIAKLTTHLNQHMLLLDALQPKFGDAITDYFFSTHSDTLKLSIQQPPTKQWALTDSNSPGIAVNAERVFVSQFIKDEIWVYDHAGQRQDVWTGYTRPYGLWATNDCLYVADYSNNQIRVLYAIDGEEVAKIPAQQAFDVQVQGDTLWIARHIANKVTAHSLTTGKSRDIGTKNSHARGLAVSGDRLYVLHDGGTYTDQITIYDAKTDAFIEAWNLGLSGARGLAVQGEVLAVADYANHRVRLFNHLTKVPLGDIQLEGYKHPTACRFDAKGLWVTWRIHGVTYHDLTVCYASMRALSLDR